MANPAEKIQKIIGFVGLFIGPLFLPMVFSNLFAVEPFSMGEMLASGAFAFALIFYSVIILLGSIKNEKFVLLSLALYIILGIEIGARLFIKANPTRLEANRDWARSTYKGRADFSGHPFTQFTGPEKWYRGFPTVKPKENKEGVRVVTLGGSTTASGYPNFLQEFLGSQFEVLNFGQAYFTSAHTMINYLLNVVNLRPDFIVVHQGWNDNVVRNTAKNFRSDYAHALKSWELPFIPDKYLIRFSALYRHLKHVFTPFPSWRFIDHNLQMKRVHSPENFNDLTELEPFKKHIKVIITIAKDARTKVILTTQPYVTQGPHVDPNMARHIDQCNEIMRELAKQYEEGVILVDLQNLMQGKHDHQFTDLAHLKDEGKKIKARYIAEALEKSLKPAQ